MCVLLLDSSANMQSAWKKPCSCVLCFLEGLHDEASSAERLQTMFVQVVVDEPASSGVPQDQSAGQQLESAKTEVPPKVAKSNHAALEVPAAAADSKMQKEQSKGGQEGAAGQELMQGKQAIPESPNKTNPSAKSSTSNPKIAA